MRSVTLLVVLCVVSLVFQFASAATPVLTQTFDDPTVTTEDFFGHMVAIDGNHVLVGANGDDTNGGFVGQAHLFDASTGALIHTFNDPTLGGSSDRFGGHVAIDGNFVLIGAVGDDTLGVDVGQAHLFDATTGGLLRTFNDPTPTGGDGFSQSVAIDGNNVLIGAAFDSTVAARVGQAHLFDATTGALLQTFDDPTPSTNDAFGISVAIDGNFVLVGAQHDSTLGFRVGQAHLFNATTGALIRTFENPSPAASDLFGITVALDGNNIAIGATSDDTSGADVGQVYLFDATTGSLLRTFDDPTITTRDQFGTGIAIDGNNLLVSAAADDSNGTDVGQAHLFDITTGTLKYSFDDPNPTTSDNFGYLHSVALDGNNALIGTPNDDTSGTNIGQAYLFALDANPTMLYGIGAFSGDVYLIDPLDVTNPVFQFSLGGGRDFAGLSYSRQRSTYFAFERDEDKLYEFDSSGTILNIVAVNQPLVPGSGPRGITFDRRGRLYLVGTGNVIYEVDPDTGVATETFEATGPTSEIEGLATLDNKGFIAVGVSSQIFLLDRDTGELTNFFDAPVADLDAMTRTVGGTIYMSQAGSTGRALYSYNPFTEVFSDLGNPGFANINGLVEKQD